jgi:hypothetical protein
MAMRFGTANVTTVCESGSLKTIANIKMKFKRIGFDGVNWIHLAQDRAQWRAVVNTIMDLRASLKAEIF